MQGAEEGWFGAVTGAFSAASAGVTAAVIFSLIMAFLFKAKTKKN